MTVDEFSSRNELRLEISRLREIIKLKESEIELLRKKIAFFEAHETIARGVRGETIVASPIKGIITGTHAPHDVSVEHLGLCIEVKFSGLNDAVKGRANPTKRWAWGKVLGESGNKAYDRLILFGDKDERYEVNYLDSAAPYVMFDIPYGSVRELAIQTGKFVSIQLSTNPSTARSAEKIREVARG